MKASDDGSSVTVRQVPLTQILSPRWAFLKIDEAPDIVNEVPLPPDSVSSSCWRDETSVVARQSLGDEKASYSIHLIAWKPLLPIASMIPVNMIVALWTSVGGDGGATLTSMQPAALVEIGRMSKCLATGSAPLLCLDPSPAYSGVNIDDLSPPVTIGLRESRSLMLLSFNPDAITIRASLNLMCGNAGWVARRQSTYHPLR